MSGRRSDLRKMFTDGQTDGRRTPHDRISSWNELKVINVTVAHVTGVFTDARKQWQERHFTQQKAIRNYSDTVKPTAIVGEKRRSLLCNTAIKY